MERVINATQGRRTAVWLWRRCASTVGGAIDIKDAAAYAQVPQERVRNLAIVAHVDHGKTTLSDRLLELTGAIPSGGRGRFLDHLPVERSRGITVKAQSASILWKRHLINLIDTPGHVDFSYEVSRSLAACQGVVLLVDATQGVQAQTMANYRAALDRGCKVLPCVTKVDSAIADVGKVSSQLEALMGVDPATVLRVSGKTGEGVTSLLDAFIDSLPPPAGSKGSPMRALLLDASWNPFRGAICVVQVVDGRLRCGERVESVATGEAAEILELGLLLPEAVPLPSDAALTPGMVGYMITSARSITSVRIGDTLRHFKSDVGALPGIKQARACIFQGIYPPSADEYDALRHAVEKLLLNDSSVSLTPDSSAALGPGFTAGFLGLLHAEVFRQRLREEFGADIIATAPTVPYRVTQADGSVHEVRTPSALPDSRTASVEEPMVMATLVCPRDCVGPMVELCVDRRGVQMEHTFLDDSTAMLRFRLPLADIAVDFADRVKSLSEGFATFDYEPDDWQGPADVVRVDILVNGAPVDALASVCHAERAQRNGRAMVARLKDMLPKQSFEVAIQAVVRGRVVARESISALRKNVLAKCYGGDISRKKKLLSKQAEGKRRMKRLGSVDVPHEAFGELLKIT